MTDNNNSMEMMEEDQVDPLLRQLLHLKRYETPVADRITKNKQNIMREVREISHRKHWNLGDLLEMNIPWFFAEPRYGIAALFIVFGGLQFLGISSQKHATGKTGIYTSDNSIAAYDSSGGITATNSISYPRLPDNLELFARPNGGNGSIIPAGRIEEQ